MKLDKKKIIWIASSIALLLTAVVVGVLCALLLGKEKKVEVTLAQKVAIIYDDETDVRVPNLFGVHVQTKEDYWILYEGYDKNVITIGIDGNLTLHATGTTTVSMKICTKTKTLPYILTLHVVSRGYATNLHFEHSELTFSYLDSVYNRLTIESLNNQYLYPVEVSSSHNDVIYDATTGKLSYVGERLSFVTPLSATITCKVRKSESEYLEESFVLLVDFTKYATNLEIHNVDANGYQYTIHAGDSLPLNVVGTNAHEAGAVDVEIEYAIISRPEGAIGNELDNTTNTFHAGNKLGVYEIVAKAKSGIHLDGRPKYISSIFRIVVVEELTNEDVTTHFVDRDGKEVSPNLLYVGNIYQLVVESRLKQLVASNLFNLSIPNHMFVSYDKTQVDNNVSLTFLFDQAGEFTFLLSYLDYCDSSNHATMVFSCNFKVFEHTSTTITLEKSGNKYVPVNHSITLELYDKAYEKEAIADGYSDKIKVVLQKSGILFSPIDVRIGNTNIAYFDKEDSTIVAIAKGKTSVIVNDPTTNEVWEYELIIQEITGSIENLGNITLYLNDNFSATAEYPSEITITYTMTPIYAVKDWEYDENVIDVVVNEHFLVLKAKEIGSTSLTLCGISYATITVVEYAHQEEYEIILLDGFAPIENICGYGNELYHIIVTKNGEEVKASFTIQTVGLYAFLLENDLYVKYEESGTLTIYATIEGVTITKTIQVSRRKV